MVLEAWFDNVQRDTEGRPVGLVKGKSTILSEIQGGRYGKAQMMDAPETLTVPNRAISASV